MRRNLLLGTVVLTASPVLVACNDAVTTEESLAYVGQAISVCNETVPAERIVEGIPAYAQCASSRNSAIYSNNGVDTATSAASSDWKRTQFSGGYQCTELLNRYWLFRWKIKWTPTGDAWSWCSSDPPSSSGIVKTTTPVHGDAIVFGKGVCGSDQTYGHVALVDTVDVARSRVTFVEQNQAGRRTDAWSCATCFLHVVANDGSSSASGGAGNTTSTTQGGSATSDSSSASGGRTNSESGSLVPPGGRSDSAAGGAVSQSGGRATRGGASNNIGGQVMSTSTSSSGRNSRGGAASSVGGQTSSDVFSSGGRSSRDSTSSIGGQSSLDGTTGGDDQATGGSGSATRRATTTNSTADSPDGTGGRSAGDVTEPSFGGGEATLEHAATPDADAGCGCIAAGAHPFRARWVGLLAFGFTLLLRTQRTRQRRRVDLSG